MTSQEITEIHPLVLATRKVRYVTPEHLQSIGEILEIPFNFLQEVYLLELADGQLKLPPLLIRGEA